MVHCYTMKLIRKNTPWTNPSPQTTQTQHIILVQREFYRKVGEGQCIGVIKDYWYQTKLGIPRMIYSATQVVLLVVWIKL
jgi:hypothetical protein